MRLSARFGLVSLLLVAGCPGGDSAVNAGDDGDAGNDSGADSGSADDAGDADGDGQVMSEIPEGCGDGSMVETGGSEQCDDGNNEPNDGCSRTCTVELGYLCPRAGGTCVPKCGDGLWFVGEECDDGNNTDNDGCTATCALEYGWACPAPNVPCVAARCGDGALAGTEACDDFNDSPGDGCGTDCRVEDGWLCIGGLCSAKQCGDGIVVPPEFCDDGSLSGGCLPDCSGAEPFYRCLAQGGACTRLTVCGDGRFTADEGCDDGNDAAGDGCSPSCTVEPGFTCPGGFHCSTICGDGIVAGNEQCDDRGGNADQDDDTPSTPGCDDLCNLEPNWHCPTGGATCTPSVCGNGVREGLEQCDDGSVDEQGEPIPDHNLGDGCTPFCTSEPKCAHGSCESSCGDGIIGKGVGGVGAEDCDDGNTRNNDGCSKTCRFEPGYWCREVADPPPASVQIPVIYRDFKAVNFKVALDGDFGLCRGGTNDSGACTMDLQCPGGACDNCNGAAHCCDPAIDSDCSAGHVDFERPIVAHTGMVLAELDAEGKPVSSLLVDSSIENQESFYDWYRDSARNLTVVEHLELEQCPGGGSCENALCVGGRYAGQACKTDTYIFDDSSFFPLTGKGFNDPALVGSGAFDEGYDDNQNFHFTSEVRYWFEYEGDEVLSFTGDDDVWVFINGKLAVDIGGIHGGQNGCISLVSSPQGAGCDANLRTPAELGLGTPGMGLIYEVVVFQAERHTSESNYKLTLAGFFSSQTECEAYCGDGVVTPGEKCDLGSECVGGTEAGEACGTSAEVLALCTGGGGSCQSQNSALDPNVTPAWGGCEACQQRGGYCGDNIHQPGHEACDLGAAANNGSYNGCNPDCTLGPRCGDGMTDTFGAEQCDNGTANVNDVYGACRTDCKYGPRCGDGVVQSEEGEECDNTTNLSPYNGCAPGCKLAPTCGDGKIQAAFGEQCDDGVNNGAYGGCQSICKRADYCGDGRFSPAYGEQCDDGNVNNFDGCDARCQVERILL